MGGAQHAIILTDSRGSVRPTRRQRAGGCTPAIARHLTPQLPPTHCHGRIQRRLLLLRRGLPCCVARGATIQPPPDASAQSPASRRQPNQVQPQCGAIARQPQRLARSRPGTTVPRAAKAAGSSRGLSRVFPVARNTRSALARSLKPRLYATLCNPKTRSHTCLNYWGCAGSCLEVRWWPNPS